MWDYNKRYLCHWNPRKGKKGQEVTEIVLGCPKSIPGFSIKYGSTFTLSNFFFFNIKYFFPKVCLGFSIILWKFMEILWKIGKSHGGKVEKPKQNFGLTDLWRNMARDRNLQVQEAEWALVDKPEEMHTKSQVLQSRGRNQGLLIWKNSHQPPQMNPTIIIHSKFSEEKKIIKEGRPKY